MYSISAPVKLFSKINLPEYNLGLSLKVEVERFKESGNGTTCYLLVGIRPRDGKFNWITVEYATAFSNSD